MENVTIILLVSREEYIEKVLSSIELLDCSSESTNLFAVVDSNNELFVKTRNLVEKTRFNKKLVVKYDGGFIDKHDYLARRYRIADIHNYIKKYLFNSDYIFIVEDDTIIQSDTLKKLLLNYRIKPNAGFIEGVQLGRWGTPYVGAWKVDNVYEPTEITSIVKNSENNLEKIDTGGFYCVLTKFNTYYNHKFDVYGNNILGPDFNFGLSLRREGYENYIDWDIITTHKTEEFGDINITTTNPKIVQFKYDGKKRIWESKEISEHKIS